MKKEFMKLHRPLILAFAALALSSVAPAATVTYSTTSYWSKVEAIVGGMGPDQTPTFGQTFIAPSGYSVTLNDFSFVANSYYPHGGYALLHVRPFVYKWSGNLAGHGGAPSGPPLFLGDPFNFSPPPFTPPDWNTGWVPMPVNLNPGVPLQPGAHYVMGFTISEPADYAACFGDIQFQCVPVRNPNYSPPPIPPSVNFGGGGAVWFNNSNNFPALNTTVWDTWGDIGTMAFIAHFTVLTNPPAPPILTCPDPLTLQCTNGSATASLQLGVLDTNGYPVQVVWTVDGSPAQTNDIPAAGSGSVTSSNLTFTATYGDGAHLVLISASNGQAPPVTCSATVTVVDTLPPQILDLAAAPNLLWPPNHRLVPVEISLNALDACDPAPTARIIQVTSNEPQDPSEPDWEITGPLTLNLRADRFGQGTGRIYTILIQCQDATGNLSTASVDVSVPHDARQLPTPGLQRPDPSLGRRTILQNPDPPRPGILRGLAR